MRAHGHDHHHRHKHAVLDPPAAQPPRATATPPAAAVSVPSTRPTFSPTPTGPTPLPDLSAEEEGSEPQEQEQQEQQEAGKARGHPDDDNDAGRRAAGWQSAPKTSLPGLNEALGRLISLPFRPQAAQNMEAAAALLARWPKGQPRACISILAFPLTCPEGCQHSSSRNPAHSCNASVPLRRTLKSLNRALFSRRSRVLQEGFVPYPIVVFHTDWPREVREWVASASRSTVLWQQINFDEETLPYGAGQYGGSKEQRDAVLEFLRPYHPHGIRYTSPGYHGYGYRLMCRFFAGLIMHAPPLSLFDYYWRMDNGDSLVTKIRQDPFAVLQQANGSIGVHKHFTSDVGWQGVVQKLVKGFDAGSATRKTKAATLRLFHERDVNSFTGSAAPLLFYNNFEILDMRRYRTSAHWHLFLAAEKAKMFLCPSAGESSSCTLKQKQCSPVTGGTNWAHRCHGWGDANFRTLATTLRDVSPHGPHADVVPMHLALSYQHPVPWC